MDWCRVAGPRGLCRPLDEEQVPNKQPGPRALLGLLDRAGQGRAGQGRAGRAGQEGRAGGQGGRAGQGRAGLGLGQGRAGGGRAGQGRAGAGAQDPQKAQMTPMVVGLGFFIA